MTAARIEKDKCGSETDPGVERSYPLYRSPLVWAEAGLVEGRVKIKVGGPVRRPVGGASG